MGLKPRSPFTPKAKQTPVPGVEKGDSVFFHHQGEPHAGKVLAHGRHGVTLDHDGERRQVYWSAVIGHKERVPRTLKVVDHGEAGAIMADQDGRRRFVAGAPAPETRPLEPGDEDLAQLQAGVDKLTRREPFAKSLPLMEFFDIGAPTPGQIRAGNYKKPRVAWQGLELAIENPAGSVRRGFDQDGHAWETRMVYDYGYVVGSMGVDGDPVDVYLGPDPDAPLVFVVHQRQAGHWSEYDEDKAMLGFASEEDARVAYLQHYDDERFLGDVTTLPVAEFVAKVRATVDAPAMIKSFLLLLD